MNQFPHTKHTEVTHVSETLIIISGEPFKKQDHETQELRIIEKDTKVIDDLVQIIDKLTNGGSKQQKVRQVLIQNFNNNKFIVMSLTIPSNQKAPIVSALVDADTLQPVTAIASGTSNTSDNTAAATVDADGNLVGVAPGTGNLTTVNTWTYTDSNTQQPVTVQLTTVTDFSVTAVITAERVQQVVTLGTAVAQ